MTSFLRCFWSFFRILGSKMVKTMVLGSKNEKNHFLTKTSRSFCHFKWRFHIGKSIFCIFPGGDPGFLKKRSFLINFPLFFRGFWSFLINFSSNWRFEGLNHCHQRFWGQIHRKSRQKVDFCLQMCVFFTPKTPAILVKNGVLFYV